MRVNSRVAAGAGIGAGNLPKGLPATWAAHPVGALAAKVVAVAKLVVAAADLAARRVSRG